jgi:hypothetical protein
MFLKDVESWLKRGQYVRFLRELCPQKNIPPKYNAASGIIAGELLTKPSKASQFNSQKKRSKIPHNTGYLVKTCIARNFLLTGLQL